MNNEEALLNDNKDNQISSFDWILACLMLFGAIIAGITVYLLLFNPEAALLKKLPKVSSPNLMDYILMCSQILVGIFTALYVFFFKGKVIKGFIFGLGINAFAYLYQMLFQSTFERSICEYVIPYSMGPILIITVLIKLMTTKNKAIRPL